jgi:AraC family transcriptional regulator of arabinose operon
MHRGPVAIGDVLYKKGGSYGPRVQKDFQLVVIHSGSLTLKLDQNTIDVPENQGILLSPGHHEHFFFSRERETHHSWVAVAPPALTLEMRRELAGLRGPIPFGGRMASLLELARHNLTPFCGTESLQKGFYHGLAISILCDFASAVSQGRQIATAGEKVLIQMDGLLADTYTRALTLKEIARAVGVSQQHLLTLCRAAARPSPIKQLYAKRLNSAEDLLLRTGLSIGEVANQCGFVNQFHFSRKFKQSMGQSPRAWRNEIWKR